MRRTILVALAALLAACGGGASEEDPTSDEAAVDDTSGGERAAAPLADPATPEGILQRLARAMPLDTSEWDAETNRLVEPGGVEPLVGTSRAAIVASLGEPNAADYAAEGRAGWTIGRIETARMGHPPILVVELDAAGVVTGARFQLSM